MISLADSQVLTWIDELNGVSDAEENARRIKSEIRQIRKMDDSIANRRRIRTLYNELDKYQFKKDYMSLIIDREKDYWTACKGFVINGTRYVRLLGTVGGIKNSTIVFVSDAIADELKRRIDNGRNQQMQIVPAKLEAYRALACSASAQVSTPNGVIVVDDCETEFLSDVIYMNDECDGEPKMEYRKDERITLDESDGYGIMLPSLAERWSEELGLDYLVSGVNTRCAFEKGMVFTFDFVDFAEKIAGKYTVKDAWGVERDVRDAELILTTSMLKLWDSYDGIEHYMRCCDGHGYSFRVTKACPKELENERSLNYQFIQPHELDDNDIEELIKPTVDMIKDVLQDDPMKTVLFLKGTDLNDRNVLRVSDDCGKAIMADVDMANDPYVRGVVFQAIKNRINEAKVGVLNVHGNYSIASGDPYALCQHIFGLPVTGILNAGEIYNKYWCDCKSEYLVCYRAPMSCAENIRLVQPHCTEVSAYWYKYMTTCTIFNCWDTCAMAMNGMDKDGDLVMITDNPVLIRTAKRLPALMCVQRKAMKMIPTEEDAVRSNIASFGNDIGRTTNWVTSMYERRAGFKPESEEYQTLTYRIRSGQLFQQNSIDVCGFTQ